MKSFVRFSNSAWRCSDSSCSVTMSMSQPVAGRQAARSWPRPPVSERELLIRHHDLHPLAFLVEHDLGDLRRGQRIDDEVGRVGCPRNDVDLLALELIDHRLHARAAYRRRRRPDRPRRSREITAILARDPGSRATALTSTMPS